MPPHPLLGDGVNDPAKGDGVRRFSIASTEAEDRSENLRWNRNGRCLRRRLQSVKPERAFLATQLVKLDSLQARDGLRHAKILHGGFIDVPRPRIMSSPAYTTLQARIFVAAHLSNSLARFFRSDEPVPPTSSRDFSGPANHHLA
ncbi:hypothetical protein TIFTF001_042628, partial [Ficus carica]